MLREELTPKSAEQTQLSESQNGYAETADYNGNVKADLWFERAL